MAEYTRSAGRTRYVHTEDRLTWYEILARVILYIFGVIMAFIAMRFVLELFGANPAAPFVQFVYRVSGVFMAPFYAIFPTYRLGVSTFDWSALVAILVYALIAWGIVALLRLAAPYGEADTVERVRNEDDSHVDGPSA